jgi:phosphoribosylaminoimidazole carboxylase/phosphoribosylaminoimidazole-succinocarboxamide synthase
MVKKNIEKAAESRVASEIRKSVQGCSTDGSTSDLGHSEKACGNVGMPCELQVKSAHKGPEETLGIKEEYEGDGIPTIFVTVADKSNGLGLVMPVNTAYPVISCPSLKSEFRMCGHSLKLPIVWLFSRRISLVCCSDTWIKQLLRMSQTLSKHIEHMNFLQAG